MDTLDTDFFSFQNQTNRKIMKIYDFFTDFVLADYLLNRLHNSVAHFDTFILNIKKNMINYLKSCVGIVANV